jgi:hypothetical protein
VRVLKENEFKDVVLILLTYFPCLFVPFSIVLNLSLNTYSFSVVCWSSNKPSPSEFNHILPLQEGTLNVFVLLL